MMVFRLLLLSLTSLVVYAGDVTTSIPSDLPVPPAVAPHQNDTDAAIGYRSQGSTSLQAELPSSKMKREQTLRNILAAKRRQVLGQRSNNQLRGLVAPRLRGDVSKELSDTLEVQESRHGVYVATPTGTKAEVVSEEEAPEPLTRTSVEIDLPLQTGGPVEGIENVTSKNPELIKQSMEPKDLGYDDQTTVGSEINQKSGSSRTTGYLATSRNSSQNLQRNGNGENDPKRANNTVIMSESLYKHFRPVESNVPIEDITQFLYFGQKLSAETQNTTSSNSLEVTPTVTPILNSRRRFPMKRFSSTTSVPVPILEEMMNEEMNIAVEKQTVERNNIPRIKNAFRSPSASSLYFRKSPAPAKPVDPTIVSNVISQPETKNASEVVAATAAVTTKNEEHPRNPSAHSSLPYQVRGTSHSRNASENAAGETGSTQISNGTNTRGATSSRKNSKTGTEENKSTTESDPVTMTSKIEPTIILPEDNRLLINGHSSGYLSENSTSPDSKKEKVPVTSTDTPEGERSFSTTLRIVVAEVNPSREKFREVDNDGRDLRAPGGFPPVVLPAQQHVYAYTITNVTRLLRNYSGPGVSSKEEGEQQGPAPVGTAEISDGSSSGIVATRSRSDLSAGPAAEGVTTLEGEQVNHRSGDYGPGSEADAASRGETSIRTALGVNKTPVKVPDSEIGESVHEDALTQSIGSPSLQEDLRDVDQRMLQKSASAVLNQRPSEDSIGDRVAAVKGTRRRDQSRRHNFRIDQRIAKDHRRTLSAGSERNDSALKEPAPREERRKSSGVRSSRWKPSNESMQSTRPTDNVMDKPGDPHGVNGKRNFEQSSGQVAPDLLVEQSLKKESDMLDRHAAPNANPIETTTTMLPQDEESFDGFKSVANDESSGLGEVGMTTAKVETSRSNTNSSDVGEPSDRDKVLGDKSVKVESVTTEAKSESVTNSAKETVTVQSTIPPSIFPVTPRILTHEEATAITADESGTEVPTIRTSNLTETNRPFGIAENLSPSEIQQMYRSSNATKPDPTTTVNPVVETKAEESSNEGEGEVEGEGESTTVAGAKLNDSRSEENWKGHQPGTVSIERSPEVRGRNLSDKTRDKDDVLPIMHLYNTTSIFNETSSLETSPPSFHGTETRHVVLPVGDKKDETDEKGLDPVTTALPTTGSLPAEEVSEAHDAATAGHNPGTQQLPDRSSAKPENVNPVQQKGSQSPREPVVPPASSKGNNFTTTAGTNRTRHRYHHHTTTSTSKFISSTYNPALNSSYIDTSLLSPRLRDPVNMSEVISKRHEGDTIATQETVAVVSYILATLVVFPIAVGVGLILRRLIIRNRKMLEESDTSSEISCRKDTLNLENGDFKTSIEKAITKLPRIQHLCHEAEKPPPPPVQESRWEFPRDKLRLQTVLGQGNFGQVWKAEADDLTGHQGTTRLVAVKTVKEGTSSREKEDLVRELEIMQQLGNHPNVVTLLGCCTEEEPHYLILEYVMYGKLLAYLRDHRTRQDFYNFSEDSAALTSRDLTVFGYCVARGMEYLASKKIIHRDLAARNVLVDHNKLCKIADFGMSRFANEDGEVIETRHGRNALPIRWMAPESLIYSLFTTKTDVWSFGILMWEIVTLGSTPYPDMTAREVMRNVQSGYRLERPSHCRSELFRVISRCWQADPDRRPEFQVLRRDLAQLLEDNMNGHYVDLESFASECTD